MRVCVRCGSAAIAPNHRPVLDGEAQVCAVSLEPWPCENAEESGPPLTCRVCGKTYEVATA